MKLVVIRSNLKDAVSSVERATNNNANLPILKNLLLEATNNKISLTATNLEVAITHQVSGKVIEGGRATVPAATLSDLVSNIQGERLNLEKKKNDLLITAENYEAVIRGLPDEDFPLIPKIKNPQGSISLRGGVLTEAVNQAIIATQFSELRQELNNILLTFSLENLIFVGTDSFRLGEKTLTKNLFKTTHQGPFKLLIPLKTAQDLLRVVQEDDEITIQHDENQVLFTSQRLSLISRLSEGSFPDYGAVIPKKFSAEVVVDRQEFLSAIRLAGIFGSRANEVRMRVGTNKKAIEIISSDQTVGENHTVLPAHITGEPCEAGFNWRYVADGLKTLTGKEVYCGINEEKPALLKDATDPSYFYILVPTPTLKA